LLDLTYGLKPVPFKSSTYAEVPGMYRDDTTEPIRQVLDRVASSGAWVS